MDASSIVMKLSRWYMYKKFPNPCAEFILANLKMNFCHFLNIEMSKNRDYLC